MSKRRLILIFGAVIFAIYLALPFIAGSKSWGDRDGPVIYPEGFHSSAYIIGAEESGLPKPRRSMTSILSNRPLFYGLRRRPKSKSERAELIRGYNDRNLIDVLHAENARLDAQ